MFLNRSCIQCVCVCARARVCVRACVCVVCVSECRVHSVYVTEYNRVIIIIIIIHV